jgi:hypothetical protein
MSEMVDRRILAALRPVDAVTRLPLRTAIQVSAERCRTVRNSQGYVMLLEAPGLREYVHSFAEPADPVPPLPLLTLRVEAPGGRYLPRRVMLRLPRDPSPVAPGADPGPDSILTPVQVELFPTPSAQTQVGWAVLRVTAHHTTTGERLPWTWVEVWDVAGNPSNPRARGLADARGEALVAVPGIPPTLPAPGGGAVLTTEVEVRLRCRFDGTLTKVRDQDLGPDWRDPNHDYLPDPDALKALPAHTTKLVLPKVASQAATCKLAAGQVLAVEMLANV